MYLSALCIIYLFYMKFTGKKTFIKKNYMKIKTWSKKNYLLCLKLSLVENKTKSYKQSSFIDVERPVESLKNRVFGKLDIFNNFAALI